MAIRVLEYRGDGTYYLVDRALELEGLRDGPAGRALGDPGQLGAAGQLGAMVTAPLDDGRRAFDVVVAAPKPLSVLLATEAPDAARAVVAVHVRAMAAAVDLLAEGAGRGGPLECPRAVAFTHGMNRAGDPHLHTHVLIGAREADGRPVDGWRLRRRAAAADALYQAALRHGLAEDLGRDAWVGRSGTTCVEGVDVGLLAATTSARDRDGRWVRDGTKTHPTRAEAARVWAARVASAPRLGALAAPARSPSIDERRFAAALGRGVVARHDVVRAWATAAPRGAPAEAVRRAASLLAPGTDRGRRQPAVAVADARSVRMLGPRPVDPAALAGWCEAREAIARYVGAGHRLSHLADPTGAPAATWLAVAALDAALDRLVPARPAAPARTHRVGRVIDGAW